MAPPRSFRLPLAAVSLSLLGGCAAIPDLGPKPVPVAPAAIAAERSLAPTAGAPAQAWPGDAWWAGYGDAQLASLIEEGLSASPDVAAAAARIRRARGLAQETGAAGLPSVDVQGDAGFEKQSYNNGIPREFIPQGWNDRGRAAASFSFDLDLWGRNRAALAAATSEARAAEVDAAQARLMLATDIASAYVELARAFAERDVRQSALDVRLASQRLVGQREHNGLETRGSLRQSDAQVAAAREGLVAADEAIALGRNRIAALVGAGPDRGLTIARPQLTGTPLRDAPAGVTTDLIGRRPDIAAARERLEAAASRIKAERAAFFPAISLSALVGVQSLGIGNLTDSGSTYGSAGPAISLPIFHGGALQGRYRQARAGYDLAVADYDRTVVDAYRDVADAVTGLRSFGERIGHARDAVTASEQAYAIARQRYDGGLSTYLDVLAVEDRLLSARLTLAGLDATARSLDIALVRALGGGFAVAPATASREYPNG